MTDKSIAYVNALGQLTAWQAENTHGTWVNYAGAVRPPAGCGRQARRVPPPEPNTWKAPYGPGDLPPKRPTLNPPAERLTDDHTQGLTGG